MVEQTKRPSRAVSLQAGPGEVDTEGVADVNFRVSSRAARVLGRQLALMGDQFDRERTSGHLNRLPTPLHLLRPAQTLTLTVLRDIHGQLWGVQGLSAAVKAWIGGSACTPWVSRWRSVGRAGLAKSLLAVLALVAAIGALLVESSEQ